MTGKKRKKKRAEWKKSSIVYEFPGMAREKWRIAHAALPYFLIDD